MSRAVKEILLFLLKVLLTSALCLGILRLYVAFNNKPLDTFANILFYLALSFLIVGFLSVLIIFLKSNSGQSNTQQTQDNFSYKNILNVTTLIITDGIVFIVISFLLTFIISFQNSV